MRRTTSNGNTWFAENKGVICGGLMCGEMQHFEKLGCRNILLAHS